MYLNKNNIITNVEQCKRTNAEYILPKSARFNRKVIFLELNFIDYPI